MVIDSRGDRLWSGWCSPRRTVSASGKQEAAAAAGTDPQGRRSAGRGCRRGRYCLRTLSRQAGWLLSVAAVAVASCTSFVRPGGVFTGELPDAQQVIAVINQNAQRVHSLLVNDLDVSVHRRGHLTVPFEGKLAFEEPRRLRLIANTAFSRGADIGSNEHEFWAYIRDGQRPVLLHASYEEYQRSPQTLPIHPQWVIEALGVTEISLEEEPVVLPGKRGTIELVAPTTTPQGEPAMKITVVDRKTGWIVAKRIEVGGKPIASAHLSRHKSDQVFGAVIARVITLEWPETDLEVTLRLNDVTVNPTFDVAWAQQLWRMPREVLAAGAEEINLGSPIGRQPGTPTPGVRLQPQLGPAS